MLGDRALALARLIGAEAEQMVSAAWRNLLLLIAVTLAALVAVLVACRMTVRMLRNLLGGLADTMEKLRDGLYDVAVLTTSVDAQTAGVQGRFDAHGVSFTNALLLARHYLQGFAWKPSH